MSLTLLDSASSAPFTQKGDPNTGAAYVRQAAAQAHIGVAPTVSTSAYSLNMVIGGKLTFANVLRTENLQGLLQKVTLKCKSNQNFAADLILFDSDPTNSTAGIADHTVVAIDPLDVGKIVGIVHISDWTSLGTPSFAEAVALALPFKLTTTTLYGVLVARGTPTFTSTADLVAISITADQG